MSFDELIARIGRGWSTAARLFPQVVEDPRAYPREAMILGALAALLIVLVTLTSFVVADAFRAWAKARRLRVRRKGVVARRFAVAALLLVALGIAASLAQTVPAVAKRCTGCHEIAPETAAWERGAHAEVSCYGCHAQPGPFGVLAASLARSRYLRSSDDTLPMSPSVSSARCLRCHAAVRSGVVGTDVRMRHSDVIEAGYACDPCHQDAGHEGISRPGRIVQSRMNACLACHDSKSARSDCRVCHAAGGPLDTAETSATAMVRLATRCTGCHTPASAQRCVDCHGLELPHPAEFMGKHAGLSYKSPPLCAKCHEQASTRLACECHQDVNVHGTYSEWFPLHGPMARNNGPGGCRCHKQSFCAFCHDRPVF
ncbi:MAG: cytochrome c3 family protein [Anaerosomatales bacterium]|nr:cytochrome c3 family protein [Anaerosomatales bacterium]